ncbi:MAG: CPXCG motif-containing cysteine-rich protein [Gammaproteobacteria bacterium]
MKKRRPDGAVETLTRQIRDLDAKRVDQLYGLEPVYEPGESAGGVRAEEFVAFQCPWCAERIETRVDVSAGQQTSVEDCQVCCRPIEMSVELEENGALRALRVQRVE